MDYQLTIPSLFRRAEQLHGGKAIIDRQPDRTIHRTTYGEVLARARRLAGALRALGVAPGDRVATFCWNHHQHLEAYYGVPAMGAVLHTLNIRLHPDDLAYVAAHAGDRVAIVDRVLWAAFEKFRDRVPSIEHVIVVGDGAADIPRGALDYEALVAGAEPHALDDAIDEQQAAGMCYTSGTTGRPKGVVYSHRSTVLHTLGMCLADIDVILERDVLLAVVPLFHANAWGTPYAALMMGAAQVLPGPHLDATSLLELIDGERVTVGFGVPTIWTALLQALQKAPGTYDLSALRVMLAGGSAAPPTLIRALEEQTGAEVLHAWGMTEMSPLGSHARLTDELRGADAAARLRYRSSQGRPVPLVEIRARNDDDALVPWDGETMGELEVRGPWISSAYYEAPEAADRFTSDGWFRTGDIASIDPRGYIRIRDRSKDVIKSGGEWISSIALETALAGHPAVLEAAVVGVPHPRWVERPIALVVRRPECACSAAELHAFLESSFPRWWLPDGIEFVDAIPKTTVGKTLKRALREQYDDYYSSATTREGSGITVDHPARSPA